MMMMIIIIIKIIIMIMIMIMMIMMMISARDLHDWQEGEQHLGSLIRYLRSGMRVPEESGRGFEV